MLVFHILGRDEWALAEQAGVYTPPSLAMEGFIHLSHKHQVAATVARFFCGRSDLVVLSIDDSRVDAPIRAEFADGEAFPHLYGPLNLAAVVDVSPWPSPDGEVND